jgi:hypothetical protein
MMSDTICIRHTRAAQTGQRAERVKLTSADEDEG